MNAIVLFSHGSLLCGAGQALREQAATLEQRGLADRVRIGYLNYSEPLFADTVHQLATEGVERITVVPYFLVPGKFVRVDLPKALDAARSVHPNIAFEVTDAIGFDARLADALVDSASHPIEQSHWRDDLLAATRHCRPNPECPLYRTALCPLEPGDKPAPVSLTSSDMMRDKTQNSNGDRAEEPSESGDKDRPLDGPKAMLVMVHGSPRPIANEDMFRVVDLIRKSGQYPIVEVGFMECNEPDIPTAIDHCVGQGATSVVAVPYFLHTGTHVADDLPTLIEQATGRHSAIRFEMGSFLGRSHHLTDILVDRIQAGDPNLKK